MNALDTVLLAPSKGLLEICSLLIRHVKPFDGLGEVVRVARIEISRGKLRSNSDALEVIDARIDGKNSVRRWGPSEHSFGLQTTTAKHHQKAFHH